MKKPQHPSTPHRWIHSFLSNRPQAGRTDTVSSPTAEPLRAVLSPFLYTMTGPAPHHHTYFKSSDGTAILRLLHDSDSVSAYQNSICLV
ncbi:hypothetical protein GBF38_015727 [Nibea albiflora]|uniref:Uncharacterized protein n=1 Tax=Nibea albiflora TaxID=240163 RepID=A0ACB7FIP5_NIBAL|nr:hypothetical protein GBF38_015727 [Nibea albiflora]